MNTTAFIAQIGWEIAGFQSGKVTKVKLSDDKVIPFSEQLRKDIEAFAAKSERASGPATINGPAEISAA